jgi:predicted MPP superfamily phosphohydrolase
MSFFRLNLRARQWSRAFVMWLLATAVLAAAPVTFVFTSDVHFGINRGNFRGGANVESQVVNAALVAKLNALPTATLPPDDGLRAGKPVGPIDFVIVTGDIANRQELYPVHIQSAAVSWKQFETTFLQRLALKDAAGQPTPLLLVPGNHDVSNAIGSPSKLLPETDATSMAEIYNRMMHPATPRTPENYRYATDRINYSRDVGGAHCVFFSMWPDHLARAWIDQDLKNVPSTTPVFLFCHDQPDIEAKHLTNPNGAHDVNSKDKFENVVADICADGTTVEAGSLIEQRTLVAWLKAHRNIVGYFHGNSNWNEFYTWADPDGDLALNTFRADSPMKGKDSGKEEKKLSFQLVTFDVEAKTLTSRECLWNARGKKDSDTTPVGWGESRTVTLAPRAK